MCFQISWVYLEVELLGHTVALVSLFEEWVDCFPKCLHHFTIYTILLSPAAVNEGPYFSTTSSTFVIVCLFDYGYPSLCEVALICISLRITDVGYIFMC